MELPAILPDTRREEEESEARLLERTAELARVNDALKAEIARREQVEQSLKENQERVAGIIGSAMDAIITVDAEQRVTLFNAAAEQMFGCRAAEAIGQPLDRFIPQRFRRAHREHVERFGQTHVTRRRMAALGNIYGLRANGEEFPAEASISHLTVGGQKFFTVIMRDISERKKLEEQFLRAQRMESIGTLAGGIAHDLNNILSPIMMAVQMLDLKVTDEGSRRMLDILRANTERGSEMVKQILSFARGVSGERVAVQPRHLIKEIVKILKETFPKSIEIRYRFAEDLAVVSGDATQLHQVLMNLCVNARDAMPAGGVLTIDAANAQVDATYAEMMPDARTGPHVRITVGDTGTGISREHLSRIFDPFFTTKAVGHGTGLGLATVISIVKGHGGFVGVYSEVGRGTQFNVYLPVMEAAQAQSAPTPATALPAGRGELILVADDEAAIRQIAQTMLEAFNYRVLTANDGAEAVALFARHQGEVAAVLTDMMMPVMDGAALVRALGKLDPQIKIIASSGFAEDSKLDEVAAAGVKHFLAKPYTAEKLLTTLADLLGHRR
jgi:PAS domain S-box-containing protein